MNYNRLVRDIGTIVAATAIMGTYGCKSADEEFHEMLAQKKANATAYRVTLSPDFAIAHWWSGEGMRGHINDAEAIYKELNGDTNPRALQGAKLLDLNGNGKIDTPYVENQRKLNK